MNTEENLYDALDLLDNNKKKKPDKSAPEAKTKKVSVFCILGFALSIIGLTAYILSHLMPLYSYDDYYYLTHARLPFFVSVPVYSASRLALKIMCLTEIPALIFSIIGMIRCKKANVKNGFAVAGTIISVAILAVIVLTAIIVILYLLLDLISGY